MQIYILCKKHFMKDYLEEEKKKMRKEMRKRKHDDKDKPSFVSLFPINHELVSEYGLFCLVYV